MIPQTLRIGFDPAVEPWAPEAKYALGEILRIAGYSPAFEWASSDTAADFDIYYGPRCAETGASISIPADPNHAFGQPGDEPVTVTDFQGLRLLHFEPEGLPATGRNLVFPVDVLRGAFWMLTGSREPWYSRDRRDNLILDGSALLREELFRRPLVSEYGQFFRNHFEAAGRAALDRPWCGNEEAAFVFTHDVDYPEIIRWIEVLRAVAAEKGGARGWRQASRILRDRDQFWQFGAWTELARSLGTRPAFYFMASKGSLLKYATGTPDAFYDIRSPRFRDLFAELKDEGCEIGLHASYHAHRSGAEIASEKELIESTIGGRIFGGRHHYWHLDPDAPNDTLLAHEWAGLQYDTSLAFEMYPGFRRGVCHPFMPFHSGQRREIDVVQLPTTWMDDHFHRRRAVNGISDPDARAHELLESVRNTNGVAIVDYHVRGMNGDFFPEYGPWLQSFLEREGTGLRYTTPGEVNNEYREYVAQLDSSSQDTTNQPPISIRQEIPDIEIGPLQAHDVDAVANFHYQFFGIGKIHGHSLAKLGPGALVGLFYGPSIDNPDLFVDVARHDGEVIGFSVYCTNRKSVFRNSLKAHRWSIMSTAITSILRRPGAFMSLLANARYVGGESLHPVLDEIKGKSWLLLQGVLPRYRSKAFIARTGMRIALRLIDFMEEVLIAKGCPAWYGAVREDNLPMNLLMHRWAGEHVATAPAQGQMLNYFLRRLDRSAKKDEVEVQL